MRPCFTDPRIAALAHAPSVPPEEDVSQTVALEAAACPARLLYDSVTEQAFGCCLRVSGPPQHRRATWPMALEGSLFVQRWGKGMQTSYLIQGWREIRQSDPLLQVSLLHVGPPWSRGGGIKPCYGLWQEQPEQQFVPAHHERPEE